MPMPSKLNETQEVYGFLWKQVDSGLPVPRWHFNDMQDMVPENIVRGKIGLEAGSGCGYDTHIMAKNNPGVKIMSLDISEGVHESKKINAALKNVGIIQGSVLEIPFTSDLFDFVYSYGVLHHTPDPNQGLREFKRVLKTGAPVFIYLYEDHSENFLKCTAINVIDLVRALTTRINKRVLYLLCAIMSPLVFCIFTVPARLLGAFSFTKKAADTIPFNFGKTPLSLTGDLYDRFRAPIEYRYSRSEVGDLLKKNGFVKVTVGHLKKKAGWLAWGYKNTC